MPKDTATLMVSNLVRPSKITDFEAWLQHLHALMQQREGFISVDIIRHLNRSQPEYISLIKFDNHQNLERWNQSSELAEELEKLKELVVRKSLRKESIGLELWFDSTEEDAQKLPPYWKRLLISVVAVFPLLYIIQSFLPYLLSDLPRPASMLLGVILLSGILTWPVMPFLSRLLKRWLYRGL